MIQSRYIKLVVSIIAVFLITGCEITTKWRRFTPMVMNEGSSSDVRLEVKITGSPSSVELGLTNGTIVPLVDNGTGGDVVSGDGVYTANLTPAQILYDFTADDVNRNFIGFLHIYDGTIEAGKYNIFADILTSSIPPVSITAVSSDMQYSENIVNIVDANFYNTFSIQDITQKFYSHFGDLYDFVNIVYEIGNFKNRNHIGVSNHVQGIGLSVFDNTSAYGSQGRLLGRTEFPIPSMFDGASPTHSHELGHQWVNFVSVSPLDTAIPHWPLSDLASGVMGWNSVPGQGLHFNFDLLPVGGDYQLIPNYDPKTYSDLSLYLMGLLSPGEVGTHFVFNDQTQTPSSGGMLLGPVTNVNIGNITTHLGPRIPDHTSSPKKYRIATIIVSKDGLLNDDAMRLYDWFAKRAGAESLVQYSDGFVKGQTNPFYLATGGRARLETRIERRILVDASRDGGVWWYPQAMGFDVNADHQGKSLANYLRSLGYKVDELPRPTTITTEQLNDYDIVIRAVGLGHYASSEIDAYTDYLQNGGNVLLLADHNANDELANSFGLAFQGITRGANQLSNFAVHNITQGVGPLNYMFGSSLASYPSAAQIVGHVSSTTYTDLNNNGIQDSSEPTGAAVLGTMKLGQGQMIFCGDTNLWETVPQPLVDNVLKWFESPVL